MKRTILAVAISTILFLLEIYVTWNAKNDFIFLYLSETLLLILALFFYCVYTSFLQPQNKKTDRNPNSPKPSLYATFMLFFISVVLILGGFPRIENESITQTLYSVTSNNAWVVILQILYATFVLFYSLLDNSKEVERMRFRLSVVPITRIAILLIVLIVSPHYIFVFPVLAGLHWVFEIYFLNTTKQTS